MGVMGPNGSGKTTLFEMLSGSNIPTSGKVLSAGQDVHRVKYRERDRMVIHYHQSYQVRRIKKTRAELHARARPRSDYPLVHVFDEPQFSTQDGYIGFMLEFFRSFAATGTRGLPVPASVRAVPHRHHARHLRALSCSSPRDRWPRLPNYPNLARSSWRARLPRRARGSVGVQPMTTTRITRNSAAWPSSPAPRGALGGAIARGPARAKVIAWPWPTRHRAAVDALAAKLGSRRSSRSPST